MEKGLTMYYEIFQKVYGQDANFMEWYDDNGMLYHQIYDMVCFVYYYYYYIIRINIVLI